MSGTISVKRGSVFRMAGGLIAAMAISVLIAACGGDDGPSNQWVASWSAAQQNLTDSLPPIVPVEPPMAFANQTIRQIVHPSHGGSQIRIKLSNLFGQTDLTFTSVHVALSTGNGAINTSTDEPITFGGQSAITIPAGTELWSDTLGLSFPTQTDLAVSMFVQGSAALTTVHATSLQTNYIGSGNQVSSPSVSAASPITSNLWLSGVDVSSASKVKVVVAFGDSITDGFQSTIGANHRWPNFLDDRLQAAGSSVGAVSVVNAGIGGNRWLNNVVGPAGATRFSRDVLAISGATHVIILLGINDIGLGKLVPSQAVTADQIDSAITTAINQAKANGLKVIVGTLLPFNGAFYFDANAEAKRQAVNTFLRSAPGVDGVVDFDSVMQNPSDPTSLNPAYDSGDHLHPNDSGYQVMANAINLQLFN
jgi:lysophospholipase L1-like esterase